MEKWRQHLRSLNPRIDLRENFYPEQLEPRHPALFSSGSLLATGLVAARLLNIIASRGGTRLKPSWIQRICALLEDALSPEAIIHCDDEVVRIIEWLEGRAEMLSVDAPEPEEQFPSPTPELDIMFAAEIESRISVAQFALAENFDLQLEYYDEASNSWPRLRATPLDILNPATSDDSVDSDNPDETATSDAPDDSDHQASTRLLIATPDEQTITIPFKSIRWLMPVTRKENASDHTLKHNHTSDNDADQSSDSKGSSSGRLLVFPDFSRPDKQ